MFHWNQNLFTVSAAVANVASTLHCGTGLQRQTHVCHCRVAPDTCRILCAMYCAAYQSTQQLWHKSLASLGNTIRCQTSEFFVCQNVILHASMHALCVVAIGIVYSPDKHRICIIATAHQHVRPQASQGQGALSSAVTATVALQHICLVICHHHAW